MEKETKVRMGLLLQAAIEDTGAAFAEVDLAFFRAVDNEIALVPVERCAMTPEIEQRMKDEGLDRLSAVASFMGEEGFCLLALLAVRLTDRREVFIEHEEAPGVSAELIEAAKRIFWDTLVKEGKITPKAVEG